MPVLFTSLFIMHVALCAFLAYSASVPDTLKMKIVIDAFSPHFFSFFFFHPKVTELQLNYKLIPLSFCWLAGITPCYNNTDPADIRSSLKMAFK